MNFLQKIMDGNNEYIFRKFHQTNEYNDEWNSKSCSIVENFLIFFREHANENDENRETNIKKIQNFINFLIINHNIEMNKNIFENKENELYEYDLRKKINKYFKEYFKENENVIDKIKNDIFEQINQIKNKKNEFIQNFEKLEEEKNISLNEIKVIGKLENKFKDINELRKIKNKLIAECNEFDKSKQQILCQLKNIEISKTNELKKIHSIEQNIFETALKKGLINTSNMDIEQNNEENIENFKYIFKHIFTFNLFYKNIVKPEWMKDDTKKIINHKKRFNNEILDYANYIQDEEFIEKMNETIKILENIIRSKYNWDVLPFGSFVQGISTIFSDLDFEIITKLEIGEDEKLNLIKNIIGDGFTIIIIIGDKLKIIKAECIKTKIKVHISVDKRNGSEASIFINSIVRKESRKILIPLIVVLKILLKINNLNDTYKGYMNSYLLFHLVYFIFKFENCKYNKNNICDFLIDFLYFYSNFDNYKNSLEIGPNGKCEIKKKLQR